MCVRVCVQDVGLRRARSRRRRRPQRRRRRWRRRQKRSRAISSTVLAPLLWWRAGNHPGPRRGSPSDQRPPSPSRCCHCPRLCSANLSLHHPCFRSQGQPAGAHARTGGTTSVRYAPTVRIVGVIRSGANRAAEAHRPHGKSGTCCRRPGGAFESAKLRPAGANACPGHAAGPSPRRCERRQRARRCEFKSRECSTWKCDAKAQGFKQLPRPAGHAGFHSRSAGTEAIREPTPNLC